MRPQEEIVSRRSTREKRSAISNDYIVYALEHESDLSIDNDPVSFDQAMSGENSDKWLMAMKEELKSMDDNNVWEMTEYYRRILKESVVSGSLRPSETLRAMSRGTKPDLLPKVTLKRMSLTTKRLSLRFLERTL